MIKEKIIEALVKAGYDTMTACQLAYNKIKELQNFPSGEYTFIAGNETITVI